MEITEIRLRKSFLDNKVLATASVCFDGQLVIHDLKVIQGARGAFLAMLSCDINAWTSVFA